MIGKCREARPGRLRFPPSAKLPAPRRSGERRRSVAPGSHSNRRPPMIALVPPDPRPKRMLAALVEGAGLDAIAADERLTAKETQTILREELSRRWVPAVADFAKIQIARLENLCLHAMERIERGETVAIDRALRIFDRLDRYHGFQRGSPALQPYGEEQRERLLAKINDMAAKL